MDKTKKVSVTNHNLKVSQTYTDIDGLKLDCIYFDASMRLTNRSQVRSLIKIIQIMEMALPEKEDKFKIIS